MIEKGGHRMGDRGVRRLEHDPVQGTYGWIEERLQNFRRVVLVWKALRMSPACSDSGRISASRARVAAGRRRSDSP